MDKLNALITPDVYSVVQMRNLGYDNQTIERYCQQRVYKWNIATQIFRELFKPLDVLIIHKNYDPDKQTMVVTVYNSSYDVMIEKEHNDPLFALAECAKTLNREDDFLSELMTKLNI